MTWIGCLQCQVGGGGIPAGTHDWHQAQVYRDVKGFICRSCKTKIDALSDEELNRLVTARAVAEELDQDSYYPLFPWIK